MKLSWHFKNTLSYFQTNRKVESLTLEDDAIGPEGAVHIADMLKENDTLTQIVSTPYQSFYK